MWNPYALVPCLSSALAFQIPVSTHTNLHKKCTQAVPLFCNQISITLPHLFGDVVLDKAIQGHHTADVQQHRDGWSLLSISAISIVPSSRHTSHYGLVAAQVAASRTAAFLLTPDLHTIHHIVWQQLALLQSWQVAYEGQWLQLPASSTSNTLVCSLWKWKTCMWTR